ncbi:3-dehydroquinate synthase [Maribacter algicola]|uniref:3-dehydroquinate synthase n=1 Tax=Meishania litoralis TaxID=3434685 RepID=A0ACC7LKJ3_9FLAO
MQRTDKHSIITSEYAVYFNTLAFQALNEHLKKIAYSKIFILVDENTKRHCLPLFFQAVSGSKSMQIIEIVSGEANKNISTCLNVWNTLSDFDADRKSLLINLGGGVITDLGGFVASTFKRGIKFINIPSTLLAMVDASVGGKTGVDLGALKNQIGVINQPEMVLIVTDFLSTLEPRQLQSGFAEMLKHGLILDPQYWKILNKVSDFNGLDESIHKSVQIKNHVVMKDPTELNLRKVLNFGHTLGHAIESYFLDSESHELLLHGEAIAIGMVMEAYLSYKLTGLPENELTEITTSFVGRYGKVEFLNDDIKQILSLLKFDKKNSHGNINFVLLETIGSPKIDVRVPENLLVEAFAYYAEQ